MIDRDPTLAVAVHDSPWGACVSVGSDRRQHASSHRPMPAQLAHAERWREEGLAYTEVEFEWIRQFYVQGSKHRQLHCWWHQPMAKLCELWERLHQLCLRRVAALEAVSRAFPSWNRSIVTEIYLSMPHLFL
eukprot:COSAG01_NODE_3302_length_6295_cov_3.185765_5_plen_132_part_00